MCELLLEPSERLAFACTAHGLRAPSPGGGPEGLSCLDWAVLEPYVSAVRTLAPRSPPANARRALEPAHAPRAGATLRRRPPS